MTRYYLISTIIHVILFSFFIESITGEKTDHPIRDNKNEHNEEDAADLEKKIKEILDQDIEQRQQKLNDVFEMVQRYRPELDNEKIKSFSEMIISSELDKIDLAEIAEDNLANRNKDYSERETEALKKEIATYLEESKKGQQRSSSEGDKKAQPGDRGTGENSGVSGDIKQNAGSGSGRSGSNLQEVNGDIDYLGHPIMDGLMAPHKISSNENSALKNRNLDALQVNEEIMQAKAHSALSEIVKQKPSKYALLPEDPFEFSEQQEQSQDTVFRSLKIGYAPRMNGNFVADGILDEWDLSRPMLPLNVKNKDLFYAQIYLAWDLENIYLAAEVVDRNRIEERGNWWTTNSVEVWFDILNNKQHQQFDGDDFQFWFAPFSPFYGKALGSHRFLGRDIPNYVRKTAMGYTVEAVFNQNEELRYLRSYLGKTIGFHFFVNTSTRDLYGYEDRLFWLTDKYLSGHVHTYTWNNPNSWGDVIFMGSAAKIKLQDKELSTEYNHFGINEWNYIAVHDGDRNLDPKTRQLLKVIVHCKSSGDLEELVLTENEPNTGKFTTELFSSTEPARENDGILQTTSGSPVEIYYNDQYTSNGHSRLVTKTYFTYYPVMLFSAE